MLRLVLAVQSFTFQMYTYYRSQTAFWELCPLVFQFYPYLDLIIVLLNLQLYIVEMVSLAVMFINISSQISSIRQTL